MLWRFASSVMRQLSKDLRATPLPLLHLLIIGFDIDN
jgi:hypothetical protein